MVTCGSERVNSVDQAKLSCNTPQQTQLHSFCRNVPPLLDMTYFLTYFSGEDSGPQARKDEGSSTGAILGGVIGGVCAVLLVIVVVLIIRRKNKKKKDPAQPLPAVQYSVVVCSYA